MTTDAPEATMHRATDPTGPFKVTREIPLWGIVCFLGLGIGQAVMMWADQREQRQSLEAIRSIATEQTQQLRTLAVEVGAKNLKDVEHDLKIADHERRVSVLEGARK